MLTTLPCEARNAYNGYMEEMLIGDRKFVSSKRAAEITGYAKDYIGQLCREGRVSAQLIGRSWYVLESAIMDHRFGLEDIKPQKNKKFKAEIEIEPPKYEPEEVKELDLGSSHSADDTDATKNVRYEVDLDIEHLKKADDKQPDTLEPQNSLQNAWAEWFANIEQPTDLSAAEGNFESQNPPNESHESKFQPKTEYTISEKNSEIKSVKDSLKEVTIEEIGEAFENHNEEIAPQELKIKRHGESKAAFEPIISGQINRRKLTLEGHARRADKDIYYSKKAIPIYHGATKAFLIAIAAFAALAALGSLGLLDRYIAKSTPLNILVGASQYFAK